MRLLHLSDLHFETLPERLYVGVSSTLNRSWRELRVLDPDLVLVSGDLTSYGAWDQGQLRGVKRWLDSMDASYVALPGNHDLGASVDRGFKFPVIEYYESVEWSRTNFARVFEQQPVVSKLVGGVEVIAVALRDRDPDGALDQLEAVLSGSEGPALVAGHYPISPVRECGVLANFGSEGFIGSALERLRSLVLGSERVAAYLCGHVHAASVLPLSDRVLQFSAGALGPGPSCGWLIDFSDDQLSWDLVAGSGPQTFWSGEQLDGADPADYHLGPSSTWRGSISFVRRPRRSRLGT